ncbi:MAG: tol-pal system YbgF family protein, partial [Candidatus Binatia bacterium]
MSFPAGIYQLSLYLREQRVELLAGDGHLLAAAPRREANFAYRRFVVFGPLDVTLHIVKGESLCAGLNGIFVDRLAGPRLPPDFLTSDARRRARRGKSARAFSRAEEPYRKLVTMWHTQPRTYYRSLRRWDEIIGELEGCLAEHPDDKDAARARWMLWQACRERGDGERARSALSALIAGIANGPTGTETALGLRELADSWLRGEDVLGAEELHTQFATLAPRVLAREQAFDDLTDIIQTCARADPLYAQERVVRLIDSITGWDERELSIAALRELSQRCSDVQAGPLARSALLALREQYGQTALTAEDQLRLAETHESDHTLTKLLEPDEAAREYQTLLEAYPELRQKDRVGLRLAQLLSLKPD